MPSEWFLAVFGILILCATFRTYHELRKQVVREGISDIIAELKRIEIKLETEDETMASLFLIMAESLGYEVKESTLQEVLKEISPGIAVSSFIGKLRLLGLVDSGYIDPAPGSATAVRDSRHALPYHFYKLTELGGKVALKLSQDARPGYFARLKRKEK